MALTQQRYTYRHDQILLLLATKLEEMFQAGESICVYAYLHGWRSSESPQATIPLLIFAALSRICLIFDLEAAEDLIMSENLLMFRIKDNGW